MAISKRLRFEILHRANHTCRYCGRRAPHVALTIDHVVPVSLGGTDDIDNLVASCVDCNTGKGAAILECPNCDGALNDFFVDFFQADKLDREMIDYYAGEADARGGFGDRWPDCPRWMLVFMGAVMAQADETGQLEWYLHHPRVDA